MESLSVRVVAIVVCVAMVLGSTLAENLNTTIEMQITQKNARPGDMVTFTCRVTNQGKTSVSFGKPFYDGKMLEYETITINLVIMPPYSSHNDRYHIETLNLYEGVILYKLTITQVEPQDSGNFACYLLEAVNIRDIKTLHVYQDIDEVVLNNSSLSGDLNVSLTENNEIVCDARRSIPAAKVEMFLDEKDITFEFQQEKPEEVVLCNEGTATTKKCFLHSIFNQRITNDRFRPTYKDNNKVLTCRGTVTSSGLPSKEVSMRLRMTFPPMIECEAINQARINEKADIRCNIFASPNISNFFWSFTWGGKRVTLQNNQETSDGEIRAQLEMNDESMRAILSIKNVSKRHFMDFQLTTENDLDSSSKTVTLQEDPRYRIAEPPDEQDKDNNTATCAHVTGALVFLSAAACWFL